MRARRSRSIATSAGISSAFRLRRRTVVRTAEIKSRRRRARRSAHSSLDVTFASVEAALTCEIGFFIELTLRNLGKSAHVPMDHDWTRLDRTGNSGNRSGEFHAEVCLGVFPFLQNCLDIFGR